MPKGIRLSAATLVERYGVPESVARHVERLNEAKVDVTEEVLRATAFDEGIARLLADPRVHSEAGSLTTERLQAIRDSLGLAGRARRLCVTPKRTWRTVGLRQSSPDSAPLLDDTELPALTPQSVSTPARAAELEDLFTSEDVKRLKLSVLTSADSQERITAIRRMVLAPGTVGEKGAVLLGALTDRDPEVRLEAIKALVPLGLNPDIAREARLLVTGSERQQEGAAERLGRLAADSRPGEVSVLLTLIAGTLTGEVSDDVRRALVESVGPAAPVLAENPDQLAGAVSLLGEQLTDRPVVLARPVRRVLARLGQEAPDATSAALEAEIDRVPEAEARRVLLGAFGTLSVPVPNRPHLARRMTAEILAAPEPETACIAIANCLIRWGHTVADVLLDTLAEARRQQRIFLARILDQIAGRADCPDDTRERIARAFLDLLKTGTRTTQAALLDCETLSDRRLPEPLKSEIAAELIQHVHEFGGPRSVSVIEDMIGKLGPAAIGPMLEVATEGVRDRERNTAARMLGELIAQLPAADQEQADLAVRIIERCIRLLDGDFPDKDVLAASIGRMCTSQAMPADTVRRVARGLQVRVGKEPYSFGLLEGLGLLASSRDVELATRVDVAEALLRLLEVDLPEMQSKRFTGGEKTIFIAGNEAAAYTDMIPILLDGIRNVCTHSESVALRARLIDALIKKWREASSWRLVWGPGNTLKLAEVLGAIAVDPGTDRPAREKIAAALVGSADVLPVIRVLRPLLDRDQDSDRMGELAGRVADDLLARMARGSGDRIELDAAVTGCLATIAARRRLGPDEQAAKRRAAVIGVLYKALRNGAPGARDALQKIADSDALPEETRSEIHARLARS